MTKALRVLMGAWDELFERLLREVIEGAGHCLEIINPWPSAEAFLDEARTGGYDVVIVTNLGLPLDFSLGLIAALRDSCRTKVIVMSGAADQEDRERAIREGAVGFYKVPMPVDKILETVEAADPIDCG